MVTFAVESWPSFYAEAAPLFPKHWEEVALHREEIQLNVDESQYSALDASGALCVVVARVDGQIIGYWVGILRPHLHYADSLTAFTDVYYVDPPYRSNGAGAGLFLAVEKELRRRGVQKMFTATKVHLDHSALFVALGFSETETVFTKLL